MREEASQTTGSKHAGFVRTDDAILCEDCADADAIYIGFIRKFGEEHLYGVCERSTREEAEQALDDYVASVDIEIADAHIAKTHEIRVRINNRYYRLLGYRLHKRGTTQQI